VLTQVLDSAHSVLEAQLVEQIHCVFAVVCGVVQHALMVPPEVAMAIICLLFYSHFQSN
jgi:hypothetical protein